MHLAAFLVGRTTMNRTFVVRLGFVVNVVDEILFLSPSFYDCHSADGQASDFVLRHDPVIIAAFIFANVVVLKVFILR